MTIIKEVRSPNMPYTMPCGDPLEGLSGETPETAVLVHVNLHKTEALSRETGVHACFGAGAQSAASALEPKPSGEVHARSEPARRVLWWGSSRLAWRETMDKLIHIRFLRCVSITDRSRFVSPLLQ